MLERTAIEQSETDDNCTQEAAIGLVQKQKEAIDEVSRKCKLALSGAWADQLWPR